MRTTKRELEQQLKQMEAALFEAEAQLERLSMRQASPPPLIDDFKIRCSIAREEAMRTGRTVRVM